jgi:spore germination cell wall hydrolase CwlJ-like protein
MSQRRKGATVGLAAVAVVLLGTTAGARPDYGRMGNAAAPGAISLRNTYGPAPEIASLPRPRPQPAAAIPTPIDARVTAATVDPQAYQRRQAQCLARAIYFEARSEPVDGQFAVARVVLNRAESGRYPDTICRVVYQNAHLKDRCQFSFACDGQPDQPTESIAWAMALGMAAALVRTEDPLLSAELLRSTHYHADYVHPAWAPKLATTGTVGRHIFYLERR